MLERQENSLWCEKYRPDILENFIGNESLKNKLKIYLDSGDIPMILLYGPPGTGKTTCGKMIINTVDCDYLYVNASDENSVDIMRNKIKNFASTVGFKDLKIVMLDEADFLSTSAQAALRNTLETFSKNTRFILTCNYIEKISAPIQSRCQTFMVTPPSKKEVAVRVDQILKAENVTYKMEDLVTIINSAYPDIRKVINTCQLQTINGELKLDKQAIIESNYTLKVIDILKTVHKREECFTRIRQVIADSQVKSFEQLYRNLYDEVDNYAPGHIASVIIIIAEAEYQDAFVVDKEICVCASIAKILSEIKKS